MISSATIHMKLKEDLVAEKALENVTMASEKERKDV